MESIVELVIVAILLKKCNALAEEFIAPLLNLDDSLN